MRLFTKLRAEQISTVAYPIPVVPADERKVTEDRDARLREYKGPDEDVSGYPQTVRAPDGTARIVHNQTEKNAALGWPSLQTDATRNQPSEARAKPQERPESKDERVVITTRHRESYESPKSELLLSPKVAERKDPEGPIVGDWYVTDYDIQTDKVIRKVYDNETFTQYFKASLGG